MALTQMAVLSNDHQPPYRQAIAPSYVSANFKADDVDNHDWIIDARGKGRMTMCVTNGGDVPVTVTLYGTHAAAGSANSTYTKELGQIVAGSLAVEYEGIDAPFPWYIVRAAYAGTPAVQGTTYLYGNLSAF